jgi:hypothetical protein
MAQTSAACFPGVVLLLEFLIGFISAFASVLLGEATYGVDRVLFHKFSFPGERDFWHLTRRSDFGIKNGWDRYIGKSVASQHNANVFFKYLQSQR